MLDSGAAHENLILRSGRKAASRRMGRTPGSPGIGEEGLKCMPTWIVAIAVILVLQTAAAFLTRLIPVASPAFMAEFGWDQSWIGYLVRRQSRRRAGHPAGRRRADPAHRLRARLPGQHRDRRRQPRAVPCPVDRRRAARQRAGRLQQRRRQSGRRRGAATLHAGRAAQPGVLDQAGRRAARRRDRGPRHPAADRGVRLAHRAADRRRRRDRRDRADAAVPLPHRSAARAQPPAACGSTSRCRCAR